MRVVVEDAETLDILHENDKRIAFVPQPGDIAHLDGQSYRVERRDIYFFDDTIRIGVEKMNGD